MLLRVMQVFLPESAQAQLGELLEDREVLDQWRNSESGKIVLQLLIPAEETEPIMDRLEQRYAHDKGFHVVLFPVEAVLPRPKEVEPTTKPENAADPEEPRGKERLRVSREEMYTELSEGLGVSSVFLALTVLSAIVAAVGLMPPLVTCGMLLGQGEFAASLGAFLLTVANVICVNLAGVATFLIQGVRPRSWWEAKRAKKATRRACVAWVLLLAILIAVMLLNR